MKITEAYNALRNIKVGDGNLVSEGYVLGVNAVKGKVRVSLVFPEEMRDSHQELLKRAEEELRKLGAEKIEFDVKFGVVPRKRGTAPQKRPVPGVKRVILVTSGKGGVGKSTVAANLAVALAKTGAKAGLFDADVYGPSITTLMGIGPSAGVPVTEDRKLLPVKVYDVKVMSLGMMLDSNSPVIWRGPLVHKAYQQLLFDTLWEDLDYLVLDLPPGTGDAQISMSQLVEVAGGIVVTTPQAVAVNDVRRALTMLEKVEIRPLGIVESMSYFRCPHCGKITYIFGEGGGELLAKEKGVPLLAKIPLDPDLVAASDAGIPIVVAKPDSEAAQVFLELAAKVRSLVEGEG